MQVSPFVFSTLVLAACASSQRIERSEPRPSAEHATTDPRPTRVRPADQPATGDSPANATPATIHCGNPAVGAAADQSTSGGERLSSSVPCWTVPPQAGTSPDPAPPRETHTTRVAARDAVEVEFCSALPVDELTHTPLYHRGDIAAVEPYLEHGTIKGARIRFKRVEGLTADWMRQAIVCHRARTAALGREPPHLADDPTLLDGAHTAVTERRGIVQLVVRSDNDTTGAAVLARARALLGRGPQR
jgi:hypothetical protein